MSNKAKRPRGRPSKYRSKFARQMGVAAQLGATNEQIAQMLGVSVDSVERWKEKHPDFGGSVKLGKDEADDRVERSLYQRATGYSHPDVHISNYQGDITMTPITKQFPPDPTSCIFWLKNRRPKEWRERQELTGGNGAPLIPDTSASDAEVARRLLFVLTRGAHAADPQTKA